MMNGEIVRNEIFVVKVEGNTTYYSNGMQVYEPKTDEENAEFQFYQKTCDDVMEKLAFIMHTDDIKDLGSMGNDFIVENFLKNRYLLKYVRCAMPKGYRDIEETDESLADLVSTRYIWGWKVTEWSDDMYDYLNGYSYGWGKY